MRCIAPSDGTKVRYRVGEVNINMPKSPISQTTRLSEHSCKRFLYYSL